MNFINTSKITKLSALSALAFAFAAIMLAAPQAHASTRGYDYGYNNYGRGNSYYASYYPTSNSSASAASASASSNSNTNVNVNVNVPVTVAGGYSEQEPVYSEPVVYNYPTVPTYYNDYTAPPTYDYAYTSPAYTNTDYSYPYNYGTSYDYGTNYNYGYSSLEATCSANTTSASVGQPVTWTANVTGGSGYYTYTWSGSNNLYGSGSSINATYNNDGQQYAQVTVTSNNGQSVTAQCTNTVTIGNGGYNGNGGGNGLTIGCAAGAADVRPGTPVTWSVEATGGSGSYTYAWSGTDGLSGSQSSVATTYETSGVKQAVVIVTSSNGMTGSQSCTPLTVLGYGGGNGNGGNRSGNTTVTPNTNNSGLSAASLFSLANIPWGWVAVLIILVLFGTVMYLLFNKSKI